MKQTQSFETIRSEGGLLPPDLLRRVLDPKGRIPGTEPEDYGLTKGDRLNEAITPSWNRLRRHWVSDATYASEGRGWKPPPAGWNENGTDPAGG